MWLLFFLSSLVFGLLVFLLNGYCDSHPILTCCLIPLCRIWLQHTNLIKCPQVLQIWLLLSGRIDRFNKWISFLFFNVTSLKLTLWFDFFCSLVHAASLNLTSLKFSFYCYCFLTVSLAFLFHVCPVYSLLSFSSAVSLELFCTTSFISSRLSLISWFTHNVTTTPPKTQHYNIY